VREEECEENRENRVEVGPDGGEKERDAVLRGLEERNRPRHEAAHIDGPYVERDNRRRGGRRRVDDVGEFLMRHIVLITDGARRGAREDRGDGAALMKDQTHDPGEKFGRAGALHHLLAGPLREPERAPRPRPEPDEAAERPEVDQQDERKVLRADGRQQKGVDDVDLSGDDAPRRDADKKCAHHLSQPEGQHDGDERRKNRPEAVVLTVELLRLYLRKISGDVHSYAEPAQHQCGHHPAPPPGGIVFRIGCMFVLRRSRSSFLYVGRRIRGVRHEEEWVVGIEFQPPTKELSTTDANCRPARPERLCVKRPSSNGAPAALPPTTEKGTVPLGSVPHVE